MQMTKDEIIREYKTAKDPVKQIGILAELNCCDPEEIKKIVKDTDAVRVKRKYTRHTPTVKTSEKPINTERIPEVVIEALHLRIQEYEQSAERLRQQVQEYIKKAEEIKKYLKDTGEN